MKEYIKNIKHETVLNIADEISCQPGQVVSKTLAQNNHHSLTLFAFEKDEEISTHSSEGDAMIVAIDGTGKITIDGKEHIVSAGETIVMPAGKPHAVYAAERFKMLLIVMFPEQA